MSDLKDKIAQRYLWNDYAHFELNRDGCTSWSYQAIMDVMKLEEENAELKAALTNIQAVAVNNLDHDMHRVYKMCDEVLGLNLGGGE